MQSLVGVYTSLRLLYAPLERPRSVPITMYIYINILYGAYYGAPFFVVFIVKIIVYAADDDNLYVHNFRLIARRAVFFFSSCRGGAGAL